MEPLQTTIQSPQSARLSDAVRSALFGDEVFETYREIVKKHGAEHVRIGKLAGLILQMLNRTFEIHELPVQIGKLLEIDEEKAKGIAVDVLGQVLVRFGDDLNWIDFERAIKEWGGRIEEMKQPEKQTPEAFVKEHVYSLYGTKNRHLAQRLELLFLDLLNHETTEQDLIERLQKPEKVGGLGLDAENAKGLVEGFKKASEGKFVPEQKDVKERERVGSAQLLVSRKSPVERPQVTQKLKPKKTVNPQAETFSDEDEREIARIREEKKHALESHPPENVDDVVKRICSSSTFVFDNPMTADRCTKIIEARVRDVRDALETRRIIERSLDQGGLGIKGRRLSQMSEELEHVVDAFKKRAAGKIAEEKVKKGEEKKAHEEQKQARAQKEEKMMNQRYAAMTGQAPKESVAPVGPRYGRTSAGISAHMETQQREGKIDLEKVRSAIERSKPATPPRRPPVQPKVSDVIATRRLAGPTEELEQLTLTDFRRLSSDPVQAITKVKDKIDLLENRGYEFKVEGIKAWRKSPLNKLYMKLAQEAVLSAVPLQEALQQAKTRGEETLSDEELKAIMDLNASLRF